jgi:hypothetical protein
VLIVVSHDRYFLDRAVHHLLDIDEEGPKVVTGADVARAGNIDVLNPDHVLATVSEGGRLQMQLTVNNLAVLFQDHRIRASGYHCAGQDPDGMAFRHASRVRLPGGAPAINKRKRAGHLG